MVDHVKPSQTDTDHNQPHRERSVTAHRSRRRLYVSLAILCTFMFLVTGVVVLSEQAYILPRLTMVSVCFFFLSTTLAEKSIEMQLKEAPWSELASRTGLTYRPGDMWLGRAESVTGTYRNYALSLYTSKMVRGHIPCTRIELVLSRPVDAVLRLRGPFESAEVVSEEALRRVFGSGSLYHIGYERFFIRSRPGRLATGLFGTDGRRHGPLRYRLLKLKHMTNLELDGSRLQLEEFGALLDSDYLHLLFDLLCDTAAAVEAFAAEQEQAEQAARQQDAAGSVQSDTGSLEYK